MKAWRVDDEGRLFISDPKDNPKPKVGRPKKKTVKEASQTDSEIAERRRQNGKGLEYYWRYI